MDKSLKRGLMALSLALPMLLLMANPVVAGSGWANVETDRQYYRQGQIVLISVINEDTVTHTYCLPTSFYVTNADGEVVYAYLAIAVCLYEVHLAPGQRGPIGTWDLTYGNSDVGEDGQPVPPGQYFIHWGGDVEDVIVLPSH